MTIEVRPATSFADVATILGPKKNPDASVCWCLSHRVDAKTNRSLVGRERGEYVRRLCRRTVPPGVLAYDDGEVAGWAGVAPRAGAGGPLDQDRSGGRPRCLVHLLCPGALRFRGRGLAHALVGGAVELARQHGAPAVEAVPVDNGGQKVDLTMAFVGTRALFERAGFAKVADTRSVSDGFPRVIMRLPLSVR